VIGQEHSAQRRRLNQHHRHRHGQCEIKSVQPRDLFSSLADCNELAQRRPPIPNQPLFKYTIVVGTNIPTAIHDDRSNPVRPARSVITKGAMHGSMIMSMNCTGAAAAKHRIDSARMKPAAITDTLSRCILDGSRNREEDAKHHYRNCPHQTLQFSLSLPYAL